jgi:hypothetical protein
MVVIQVQRLKAGELKVIQEDYVYWRMHHVLVVVQGYF